MKLPINIHVSASVGLVSSLHVQTKADEQSRSAKLWINYMQHVQTLRDFIRADWTSDWMLHLASLKKMLPLFAAAGHRNYAKSVCLYL